MSWRLLKYEEFDGATNMAMDEAILEEHLAGKAPPTLRLYGWKPSTVSIGYSQTISEEELASIQNAGLAVVRRPTGGRAVLHMDDLTYSFIGTSSPRESGARLEISAPSAVATPDLVQTGFLSPSISVAYKQICNALIAAFSELGVPLEIGSADAAYRAKYDCFHATTNADLHFQGKKMIGSAQLRRKSGVLQHGSILLTQQQNKMATVFGVAEEEGNKSRHANLFEVLGHSLTMEELQTAVTRGFESAFGQTISQSPLSNDELHRVDMLLTKYQQFSCSP